MSQSAELIAEAGSVSHLIDSIMMICRGIWKLAFEQKVGERAGIHILFPREQFLQWKGNFIGVGKDAQLHNNLLLYLTSYGNSPRFRWLSETERPNRVAIRIEAFMPSKLVEAYLTEFQSPVSDREYFIWRNIRRNYCLDQSRQDDPDSVFDRIAERAETTSQFPLRLLVIDPINSIVGWDSSEPAKVRMDVMRRMERIKSSGANLLMVAEDDGRPNNPVRFLENLADTVLDLSVEQKHGYSQRYIEVLKSRLQRDQRGKHPFSIKAGFGVTVFPSSAAVLARVRNRRFKGIERPTRFGWEPLDKLLGENAIFPGDAIVLKGAEGAFKTHIGLLFILGFDLSGGEAKPTPGRARRSIILPVRDNQSTVRALLTSSFIDKHRARNPNCKGLRQIRVIEVPGGFVQPGAIFRALNEEFDRALATDSTSVLRLLRISLPWTRMRQKYMPLGV